MSWILTPLNMPYIPQEILEIIIGYATASADGPYFSNCASFISHTFHQIVLPYKFRSLTFKLPVHRYSRSPYRSADVIPIPNFCQAINAGDAHALSLAPLVQELSFLMTSGRGDDFSKNLISKQFKKIINSLFSFRNLTKLGLEKCVISPAIMKQLGKLVQLQSLHAWHCQDEGYDEYDDSDDSDDSDSDEGALSNLQSLHTLECEKNYLSIFGRHLACIPMKNLQILKSSDWAVTKALLTTDPPVQLKELYLIGFSYDDHSLLWNYLARVNSLTHLSLPDLTLLPYDTPSPIFHFQELQYLHVHVGLAPHFADQPMKEMKINTESVVVGQTMIKVRQHWQGIVFPHVEYLEIEPLSELDLISLIPREFWREFLSNVKEVR
jgi:hypothetical protein